jgi:hypothetical protein
MTDSTRTQRSARMRARLLAEGQRYATILAPGADLDALKRAYPGTRGGTNWSAVIAAALDRAGMKSPENDHEHG